MLRHRGSKNLTIDGETFRYVVGEAGLAIDGRVPLALTAQHVRANGSRLHVTGLVGDRVPEADSKYYMGRTLAASVTPSDAERLVRVALARGWKPQSRGGVFEMQADDLSTNR